MAVSLRTSDLSAASHAADITDIAEDLTRADLEIGVAIDSFKRARRFNLRDLFRKDDERGAPRLGGARRRRCVAIE